MKTALRFSSSLRLLFWMMGYAVFTCFAFLPPILGDGVKVAAMCAVVAVPAMGAAAILAGLIFAVCNWRWTAAWAWWGARTAGVWGWWAIRVARARGRWALLWVRYGAYLLLRGILQGKPTRKASLPADAPGDSETPPREE